MHTLLALLVATVAACALARPPGPTVSPGLVLAPSGPHSERAPLPPVRDYLSEYLLPRFLMPHFIGYEDSPRMPPPMLPQRDWLNKEIYRINQMEEEDDTISPYEEDMARWLARNAYFQNMFDGTVDESQGYVPEPLKSLDDRTSHNLASFSTFSEVRSKPQSGVKRVANSSPSNSKIDYKSKETFALTPLDKGYYDEERVKILPEPNAPEIHNKDTEPKAAMLMELPRQTRQNPKGRTKTLVSEHLDQLRTGLSVDEAQPTDKSRLVHVQETVAPDTAGSIYAIAVIAAVGAALTIAIFGFAFGWYTLSKKAKAAADVDYPAYGVTGPTIDTTGDRKLAHSAHMYHYQHQKQQIIAMERNGLEQRNGSMSDPESEEENEEGDYTVYECPGFATTGDMEVKNPLFSDDPTPATPGKCEVVKQQPKE